MRLSKKDAAAKLGISLRTLDNRLKSGALQFEKMPDLIGNGWKGNSRVFVILPDPVPTPVAPMPQPQPVADRAPQGIVAQEISPDEAFAAKFLAGEVADSLGNRHGGVARKSLLGPTDTDRIPEVKSDPTSHMDSRLIGEAGNTRVENPVDSDAFMELLHPGHLERKAELYRLCGIRPLSEQQQKERIDRLRINAAFRWSR